MKIFLCQLSELRKTKYLLINFILLFCHSAFADHLINTSQAVTAALPVAALVVSATKEDYEGIKELAMSCAFSAQLTAFMKNTIKRPRPNGEDNLSFPSGHASASFTAASYFQHRYGWGWGLPMYAIASVISIQRVNVDQHYWTDVIAGAALGYLSGYLFSARYPNVWVEPNVDTERKSYGLQLKMNL